MRVFQMQRYTAIALLFFLTLHIVVVHYPPGHIDFDRVLERLDQPLWKAIDIAFLLVVLIHALTGAYMVITDLERFGTYQRVLAGAAIVLGAVAFIYGTQTILNFTPP
jgi:succinate dehydrogenase hydrophobic anchor subunit